MSFRVRRGVVPLPYAMAIGATRSEDAARFTGEVTAREGRALGVHWAFAPVADVNNNPDNPVINIRSFGEDPELVARLVRRVRARARARRNARHREAFPGHGDTATDSHLHLAHGRSGARAARRGRAAAVPPRDRGRGGLGDARAHRGARARPVRRPRHAVAADGTEVLRSDLGFGGLMVTDAHGHGGRAARPGRAKPRCARCRPGADVILLPPQPEVAVQAIVRAVREGAITEARIDASVLRVLEAKERLGLDRNRRVDSGGSGQRGAARGRGASARGGARLDHGRAERRRDAAAARRGADAPAAPRAFERRAQPGACRAFPRTSCGPPHPAETMCAGARGRRRDGRAILARGRGPRHVLASCSCGSAAPRARPTCRRATPRLLRALARAAAAADRRVVRQPVPAAPVPGRAASTSAAYGSAESSQRAAIAALFGE